MGSPSRSLPKNAIREQAAPSAASRPVLPIRRTSLDLQRDNLGGTLQLSAFPVSHSEGASPTTSECFRSSEKATPCLSLPRLQSPGILWRLPLQTPSKSIKHCGRKSSPSWIRELPGTFYQAKREDSSHYFFVTKKTGSFHPILNLRWLNACSWDACLPMDHPSFQVGYGSYGLHYTLCLCTRTYYIDDIFHAQVSENLVLSTANASMCFYLQLGFIIHLAKYSSLVPTRVIMHLGTWIDHFWRHSYANPGQRPGDHLGTSEPSSKWLHFGRLPPEL